MAITPESCSHDQPMAEQNEKHLRQRLGDMPTFGHHLRAMRLEAGLTQAELARAAGCSIPYISALELEKTTPPRDATMIAMMAEATAGDASVLFKAAGVKPAWHIRPKGRDINLIVGRNIRRIRIARGFRQYQVADEIGETPQNYSKHENGQHRINVGVLVKVAEALAVEPGAFFEGVMGND